MRSNKQKQVFSMYLMKGFQRLPYQSCHVKSLNNQSNNLAMLNIAIGNKLPK